MTTVASQITSLTVVNSIVYTGADKKKTIKAPRHWPLCAGHSPGSVNSPNKGPVTRKMAPFDDVTMVCGYLLNYCLLKLYFLVVFFLLFIRLEKKMICMSVLNECYPNQNHIFYSINIVNILFLAVYLKLMHG